jgi:hypothetical protein
LQDLLKQRSPFIFRPRTIVLNKSTHGVLDQIKSFFAVTDGHSGDQESAPLDADQKMLQCSRGIQVLVLRELILGSIATRV